MRKRQRKRQREKNRKRNLESNSYREKRDRKKKNILQKERQ